MPTLDFRGKRHVYAHHFAVPHRPLVPDSDKSVGDCPDDDNLIIHGDNLDALKALLPRYADRVKCIYIDPPYNTGNENWVYNDNVNGPLQRTWLKENGFVDTEDLLRHDKWLCMMWPRLQLLKELLAEDGVIFVSIDDNEFHHLRMLMDEIFGEENFVAAIAWQGMDTIKNDARYFSGNFENILIFSKDKTQLRIQGIPKGDEQKKHYKNPDDDQRGDYLLTPLHAKSGNENSVYEYVFPNGQKWTPPPGTFPRYSKSKLTALVADGRIWLDPSGKRVPQRKTFWDETSPRMPPPTFWDGKRFGTTRQANREAASILGKGQFNDPKPSKLIMKLIDTIEADPDALILDSFAGSGTTGQAVLALNKQDGGKRKFILVECEDYADSITAERVRRVIAGVPDAKDSDLREGLGGSFTYCTLGEPVTSWSMLDDENLPSYEALAAWLIHTATGRSTPSSEPVPLDDNGLIHRDKKRNRNYYLLYQPDMDWLKSRESMFDIYLADAISKSCNKTGAQAVVFAAGKFLSQDDLIDMNISFSQLPWAIQREDQV